MIVLWLWIISCVGCVAKDVPPSQNCDTTETLHVDQPEETIRWYALGDSITQGFYSHIDDNGASKLGLDPHGCWAKLVADNNGWILTNYGVGGSGFVHEGTVLDKLNARGHVDCIDFSNADLVTIAYGVNDWKYNMSLGSMEDDVSTGGTVYSNMRYVIEKIRKDNPNVQIVVILPMQCCRYGTMDTGWGLTYRFDQSGTLEDVCTAEVEVCDYYNIPYIDLLHSSTSVTVENAAQALPDGVHPSISCHAALAQELTTKIREYMPRYDGFRGSAVGLLQNEHRCCSSSIKNSTTGTPLPVVSPISRKNGAFCLRTHRFLFIFLQIPLPVHISPAIGIEVGPDGIAHDLQLPLDR